MKKSSIRHRIAIKPATTKEASESEGSFVWRLRAYLEEYEALLGGVDVHAGWKLPYSSVRHLYENSNPVAAKDKNYETDLLISDWIDDQHWRPLVVIECKSVNVNTHDLITYSKKAEAHRALHPYLRYGLVVGGYQGNVPGRMLAHGAEFDFMALIPKDDEDEHFGKLTTLLAQEVGFARTLWSASKTGKWQGKVQMIHRPLVTEWPAA